MVETIEYQREVYGFSCCGGGINLFRNTSEQVNIFSYWVSIFYYAGNYISLAADSAVFMLMCGVTLVSPHGEHEK
jgi:hypothetical protein